MGICRNISVSCVSKFRELERRRILCNFLVVVKGYRNARYSVVVVVDNNIDIVLNYAGGGATYMRDAQRTLHSMRLARSALRPISSYIVTVIFLDR